MQMKDSRQHRLRRSHNMSNTTSLTAPCIVLLLLVLVPSSPAQYVYGPELDSSIQDSICAPFNGSGNFSTVLTLVSQFGPCSPFMNSTPIPDVTELLQHDEARAKWIQSKASSDVGLDESSLPAYTGFSSFEFVVQIGLGTPRQDFIVEFDTGSSYSWVQCEPCQSCYPQHGLKFNPSLSNTFYYSNCKSPECIQLASGKCSFPSVRCAYGISYADNSSTQGYLGRDALTLTDADIIPDFPFGCGTKNAGNFGKDAGLLGMGRANFSLVTVTAERYGGVFSYCLPSASNPGFLKFGSDSGSKFAAFIPLLSSPQLDPTAYYVPLVGISVGKQLLSVPFAVFSSSGVILDSGTRFSRLPPKAYDALRSTFMSSMSMYPSTTPLGHLDICYNFSGYGRPSCPAVAFHFQGGTQLELGFHNIMAQAGTHLYCVAFKRATDIGIIGNWQQRSIEIIHDLAHSRVGFRPGACS